MSAPVPAAGATAAPRSLYGVAAVIVLGSLTTVLDTTIVNVALGPLAREFGAPLTTIQWVASGYTLALAAVIPATAWAIGRFGSKRLYMLALTLFTLGSALAGLAWNAETLIAFRVLQGLGGGMVMPVGMAIILQAAAAEGKQGTLMSILGLPILVGPVAGPVLGGWLVDEVSWRWMFFINVPVGAVAVALAGRVFPPDRPRPGRRLDVPGLLMLSPGLAAVIFGLTRASEGGGGFADPGVAGPVLIGAVLVAAFVVRGLTAAEPLIDLRLLRHRPLAVGAATLFLFVTGYFGSMLLGPMYFQDVRGTSVTASGLLGAPLGLAAGITMQITGRMVDRVAPRLIVLPGVLLAATGLTAFAVQAETGTPYPRLGLALAVTGVGVGMVMMPSIAAATRALAPGDAPAASTLLNINSQVAGSIGPAMVSMVLAGQLDGQARAADAFQHTYVWGIAALAAAALPALLVSARRPARPAGQSAGPKGQPIGAPARVRSEEAVDK
ncbi:DHA2 family efflux MFS transporter permease subunit [Streptomyces litchfieldiae]|uniref:DHA2 family efflux MFS transporter permease subunit n=1 Tax=Streptomyces litchfieldiae TaxID=3075543 RepID=A0ABU2MWP3_9ACTN|nr:DHA2 family efflux MFS transporter permease subunit [Streptomyces sp. DSM 44938]MDT0344979.1 DHA2 family efflux MFS transporter permease subunit [Streptomyces sp. DSM 44938]